nr:class I adenylate-forming enzyme family protein [Kibdelosporangium sp. MJ126-NF4]CEL20860.1 2,3-dihydroxybenzoate-AMP ligase [Kibdelosporangium sp. MJ126-NF4]CTQ98335.1 2,3-dihydroxybenzoate-AMP ligase (EC 2.7.7.58) [Kibdelosporangium sp. MJ126-NF4]
MTTSELLPETLAYRDLVPSSLRRSWAASGRYQDADLYTLFERHARRCPDRAAVVDADGEIGYAQFDVLVRKLATGLTALGTRPGDVVAVQLPNSRLSCALDFAIAAVGAIVLPFPIGRGERDIASLLRRSGAVIAITAACYGEFPCGQKTFELVGELPALRSVITVGGATPPGCVPMSLLLAADHSDFVPVRPDPDSAARILVSSGSEAEPKLVVYSHNALAGGRGRFIAAIRGGQEYRALFLMPLGTAFGSNATPATMAANGGTMLVQPRFDVVSTLTMIERARPTHVFGVPTMLRKIIDSPHLADTDFASVRAVVLGGSALDVDTARHVARTLTAKVINVYGSADGVNCHTALTDPADKVNTAGRPNPAVCEIRIVGDDLRPVPAGHTGEILARGPMSPMSYLAAPELDARYRLDGGWVRLGDVGRIDENGYLTVVGRRKDVIIRGGMNISPAEVEALLLTHPAVRDVACVAVPDAVFGDRMCACVATAADLSLADLTEHLSAQGLEPRKLPERLLVLPALPLGAAGKVDRKALTELAVSRATP